MVPPKLALALASALSAAIGAQAAAPAWPNPPLAYLSEYSFRGLNDKAVVDNYEISGHAAVLPGVHDFLRLVPATPLAHGAVFTSKPLQSDEWVAEVAFRVHGPATVGVTEHGPDGSLKRNHKGGRGLAFWYTKTNNPTPVTLSSNPKAKLAAPPPTFPSEPTDPSDGLVSLFGNKAFGFDGLGIVFDTSPGSPVFARSDKRNWAPDQAHGVGTTGVVSGIMDDGSGSWLEPKGRMMRAEDEADYLSKAIGECEAAFRNAQGLLWARISHVNNSIRVDLDLAPHTTLSKAGRDYAHNCFHLDGVTLPKGSYLGVSGLASGNTEPDAVDIYALDVFEVAKPGSAPSSSSEPPVEAKHTGPLEGTSDDAVGSLAQEIFLSQAKMMEAIDALTVRVESLARLVDGGAVGGGSGAGARQAEPAGTDPHLEHKLSLIETRLGELTAASRAHREEAAAAAAAPNQGDAESFKHLVQLQDRLMVELKSFGRKLDNSNSQSASTLATLSSRTAEAAQLLQRLSTAADEAAARSWVGSWQSIAGVVVLVLGVIVWRRRRDDNPWGTGKKMI